MVTASLCLLNLARRSFEVKHTSSAPSVSVSILGVCSSEHNKLLNHCFIERYWFIEEPAQREVRNEEVVYQRNHITNNTLPGHIIINRIFIVSCSLSWLFHRLSWLLQCWMFVVETTQTVDSYRGGCHVGFTIRFIVSPLICEVYLHPRY